MLMCRVSATADFYKKHNSDSGWIGTKNRARTYISNALLLLFADRINPCIEAGALFSFRFLCHVDFCSGPIFSAVDGPL